VALFLVVFFLVGEVLLRVDSQLLNWDQGEVNLKNEQRTSTILTEVESGKYQAREGELRILVLGDSIMYGAGVPFENTFSQTLESKLRGLPAFQGGVRVLNASRPGNNTLRNRLDFEKYCDLFQPSIVILGYNLNDVYGVQTNETVAPAPVPAPEVAAAAAAAAPVATEKSLDRVRMLQQLIFSSKVVGWTLPKVNLELKLRGVVMPGSEFDHMIHQSHQKGYLGWEQSQPHLQFMIDYCQRRGAMLIGYLIPEFNMIDRYSFFKEAHQIISDYFTQRGVVVVQGAEPFLTQDIDYRTLAVSRHDGHPNAKAHGMMADHMVRVIQERWPARRTAAAP
jgi:lysophospholipase L1-like esterase